MPDDEVTRRVNPDGTGGLKPAERPEISPQAYENIEKYLEAEKEGGKLDFSSEVKVDMTGYNFSGEEGFAAGDTIISRASGERIREYQFDTGEGLKVALDAGKAEAIKKYGDYMDSQPPAIQEVLQDWIEDGNIKAPHVNLTVEFGQAAGQTMVIGPELDVKINSDNITIAADRAAEKSDFEATVQRPEITSITIPGINAFKP